MLRPTPENIQNYVREIITYSDTDDDGFYDTFSYDRDLDGTPEKVISKPNADQAPITDMTEIWRHGKALDSLYYPGAEDTLPVDFKVQVDWEKTGYHLRAKIHLASSRSLAGYQLWLRAEEHVDKNEVGWYYCEKSGEYFDNACEDGIDNDDDNENGIINDPNDLADCDDPDCQECVSCGGTGVNCESGCRYGVEITEAAKSAAIGQTIGVLCLSRFTYDGPGLAADNISVLTRRHNPYPS